MSKSDLKKILIFSVVLIISAIATFYIHTAILKSENLDPFTHKIIPAYTINVSLAIGIVTVLYALKNKFKDQIGFLFIVGSFVKFAIFFMVFHPVYKADNIIQTVEFTAFFVPYLLALLIETVAVAKLLKGIDNQLN